MSIPKLTAESMRWLAGACLAVIVFAISKTWAVADVKNAMDAKVSDVATKLDTVDARLTARVESVGSALGSRVDVVSVKVEGNAQAANAVAAGILKELDAREAKRDLELKAVDRRLAELGAMAQTNQALLVAVEGLKTEIRYLTAGVAEIKADLKESKRVPP